MIKIKILQSFNQNAVLALDATHSEVIIIGKGIGFAKKAGDLVDEGKIAKVFQLEASPHEQWVIDLVKELRAEVLLMTEDVAKGVQKKLGQEMGAAFVLALASHLQFTLSRIPLELALSSPFEYELKYIYPEEYQAAVWAVAYLNQVYQLHLPASETVFFTLHFVNGLKDTGDFNQVVKLSQILQAVTGLIDELLPNQLAKDSVAYARFIVHLRYFVIRGLARTVTQEQLNVQELSVLTSQMFPVAQRLVTEINQLLQENYQLTYGDQEEFYLLLHLARLMNDGGNSHEA